MCIRDRYESLEEQNKRVDEEVEEQSERLDKTSDAVKTAAVELRTMRGLGDGVTPEEMEIELDNTKHKNTVLMEQLMHALQNAPENARPVIEDYIQQAGLVVPGLA
eukprot:TRINITY_DN3595_c0_g2_i2.p1 TRINITY_DN3595_c0_g2~~TRINITY_DN3595_c0_g2_i2.p1  ORF type:complete len:106 (+),score=29.82 TRINITY_DN3595_c0_g2_i2:121-438(+)